MVDETTEITAAPEAVEAPKKLGPVQEAREARNRALQATNEVNSKLQGWVIKQGLVPKYTEQDGDPKTYREYMHIDPQTEQSTYLQVRVAASPDGSITHVDEWEQISLAGKKRWRETRRTSLAYSPDRGSYSFIGFIDNTNHEGGIDDPGVGNIRNLYGINHLRGYFGLPVGFVDHSEGVNSDDPVENAQRVLDLLTSSQTSEYQRPAQTQPTST